MSDRPRYTLADFERYLFFAFALGAVLGALTAALIFALFFL